MDIDIIEAQSRTVAIIRRMVPLATIADFFGEAFGAVAGAVTQAGGTIVGEPFGWYHGMPTDTVDVAAGFPVAGVPAGAIGGGEVVVDERVGGQAVTAMHVGPYDALANTYGAVEAFMKERGLVPRGDMWEEYLTDPEIEPDPAKWETRIITPVR